MKKSLSEEKKRLDMNISKVVYEELMAYINQKHGFYKKGDITNLVELAIKNLIKQSQDQNTGTHTHTKSMQKTKTKTKTKEVKLKVYEEWKKIIEYLIFLFKDNYDPINRSPYKIWKGTKIVASEVLRRAISQVFGSDKRTIDHRIKAFIENRIISEVIHEDDWDYFKVLYEDPEPEAQPATIEENRR